MLAAGQKSPTAFQGAFDLAFGATTNHSPPIIAVYLRPYGMIDAPGFMVAVGRAKAEKTPILQTLS